MRYVSRYQSPLGQIILGSDGEKLSGLWFEGQKYFDKEAVKAAEERELSVFEDTRRWLDTYFAGKIPDFTPPLAANGSEFRRTVWEMLLEIPYGCVMTYGEIASRIAKMRGQDTMSAQAVGGAVGHNPVSLIIPCHRVVGSDGKMTGYAGGIEKKIWLLAMEKADMQRFSERRN